MKRHIVLSSLFILLGLMTSCQSLATSKCSDDILQSLINLRVTDKYSVTGLTEAIWKDNRECYKFLCEDPQWSISPQEGASGCNIFYSISVNGQKETALMYYVDLDNSRVYAGTDPANLGAPSWAISHTAIGDKGYFEISESK